MAGLDDDMATPPFSVELIADLHVGNLSAETARRLYPLVRADPRSAEILRALDAVSSDLAGLRHADLGSASSPLIPRVVARRIDHAIAQEALGWRQPQHAASGFESDSPLPAHDISDRRAPAVANRRTRWLVAATGVTSLVAGAALVISIASLPDSGAPGVSDSSSQVLAHRASEAPGDGEMRLPQDLPVASVMTAFGSTQLGRLSDPSLLADCLAANGFGGSTPLLGSAQVNVSGTRGVLLLLPGPRQPEITALVVGNDCGPANPDTVARTDIGTR